MLDHLHIKRLALEAGFDLCGLAPCRAFSENSAWLRLWLENSYHASLGYMERGVERRTDPALLFEGARTAVVCAVSYKNHLGCGYPAAHRTKVASYACAADYHTTIGAMLERMLAALKAAYPGLEGRAFVDTSPLFEKQLAVDAGLGWIGRQSLLVTPSFGSYVLLGELLLTHAADACDGPLNADEERGKERGKERGAAYSEECGAESPAVTPCGNCRRCVESCPTGAIVRDRVIDARRCISCATIEREPAGGATLPAAAFDGWIFGCDACQSCCPYNRRAPMHTNAAFDPLFDPLTMDAAAWRALDDARFEALAGRTPLVRSGLRRIVRNIREE